MRRRAFTLVELLLIVVLLGAVAAAMASGTGVEADERALELAGLEVASALRFARTEALRTGVHHGARIEKGPRRLRVYELDTSNPIPVEQFTVQHPVEKRLYDLSLVDRPEPAIEIASSVFSFGFGPVIPLESVAFDAVGEPVSPLDLSRLASGAVDLVSPRGEHRVVQLAPSTGRVSIQ